MSTSFCYIKPAISKLISLLYPCMCTYGTFHYYLCFLDVEVIKVDFMHKRTLTASYEALSIKDIFLSIIAIIFALICLQANAYFLRHILCLLTCKLGAYKWASSISQGLIKHTLHIKVTRICVRQDRGEQSIYSDKSLQGPVSPLGSHYSSDMWPQRSTHSFMVFGPR